MANRADKTWLLKHCFGYQVTYLLQRLNDGLTPVVHMKFRLSQQPLHTQKQDIYEFSKLSSYPITRYFFDSTEYIFHLSIKLSRFNSNIYVGYDLDKIHE